MDFFEINRVLEELPRNFALRVQLRGLKSRKMQIPRPKNIEIRLYHSCVYSKMLFHQDSRRGSVNTKELREFIDQSLRYQISNVLSGSNKEVEKRYKYYVNHGY